MEAFPPWLGFTFTSKVHSAPTPDIEEIKLPRPYVVVITGASRGIGAETAKIFASAGATGLILTATTLSKALLSTKAQVETLAPTAKVTVLAADLSNPDSASSIYEAVKSDHRGRLDVLINNAAIASTNPTAFNQRDLAAIDVSQIIDPLFVNVVGKFATFKALIPLLLGTDGAKTIINLSSATARFASAGALGYNLSQLATNRLTEALTECYGDRGVLVFAVHPGLVTTTPSPGEPVGEWPKNDDAGLCGAFILWLLKERKEWLSGRYLSANWDVEELAGKKDEIVAGDKLKMRMVV
ncbi:unnamed protein product [Periconia digitata]|uniref:NAD(P)-binding protein n=1 Tax=Periconia digitata TaxID=1303443 RepID=A0A9W4XND7_9PLEO|nr:unnamed protein product [Periconia digitata]